MTWLRVAAIAGFLGVLLGAFGAHSLREQLETAGRKGIWETAVLYQLLHAVVLLVIARWSGVEVARWAILIGILLFSGSLYILCLTGIKPLGAITPLGGISFLIGWLWLFLKAKEIHS